MTEDQILIVDCGSRVDSIQRIVSDVRFKSRVLVLRELSKLKDDKWAGVIISGSPILFTETTPHDEILRPFGFALTGRCPVLGICFGHQVIGLLHDATVFRGTEIRANQIVKVVKSNCLFEGLETSLSVKEDHCEGITLPEQFLLLATSENYNVEAMKHREKDLYGVQFHPEASGEVGHKIVTNFLTLCGN